MTSPYWVGNAPAVAGADTFKVTGDDSTTTYKFTVNGKTVSVLGTGLGNDSTANSWVSALGSSTIPEVAESVFTRGTGSASATITRTGAIPGYPQPLASEVSGGATISVSGGSGTISGIGNLTAPTGPNHWNNALNWSTGVVPVNGDNVTIDLSDVPIMYGLAQSAVVLGSLVINMGFTAAQGIGLPVTNTVNTVSYPEYRLTSLQIAGCPETIGNGVGTGCGRIKIDNGSSNAATLIVNNTGTSIEPNLETLLWKGTNAGNSVEVNRGSVAIAGFPGETANLTGGLKIGYITSQTSDANVRCGSGVTLAAVTMTGGNVVLNSGFTSMQKAGGSLIVTSGNITTLVENNGTTVYLGTGTIGSTTVGTDGAIDLSQDIRARTFTNVTLIGAATFLDPGKSATFTNPIVLVGKIAEKTLDFGYNRSLAVS